MDAHNLAHRSPNIAALRLFRVETVCFMLTHTPVRASRGSVGSYGSAGRWFGSILGPIGSESTSTQELRAPGDRWAYRIVVVIELWPRYSCTARSGTPAITRWLA